MRPLARHWRLLDDHALGRGASATVVAGQDRRSGQPVAVKVFDANVPTWTRFREARLLASLSHVDAVVTLFDAGRVQEGAYAGRDALVMARADASMAPRVGSCDPVELRRVARVVLDGLAHLGAMDVVHHDVKPSNLLQQGDALWLGDFGVGNRRRSHGSTGGTQRFAPPETHHGGPYGPWSDLYSLGRTLEALSDGTMDSALAQWVAHVCSASPADRFRTAAAARHALPAPSFAGVPAPTPVFGAGDDATQPIQVQLTPRAPVAARPTDPAPPLPERPDPRRPAPPVGIGVHLLLHRRGPLHGRDAARAALWQALRSANGVHVQLVGPRRRGGSALGRWALAEAHRLGGRRVIDGTAPRPLHALRAALDPFGTQLPASVGRTEWSAHLGLVLRDGFPTVVLTDEDGPSEAWSQALARAVTEGSVVWIERRVATTDRRIPGSIHEVAPPSREACALLLRQRAGIAPALAERLVEWAGPDPRALLHLLGELVRREALVIGPDGPDVPGAWPDVGVDPDWAWAVEHLPAGEHRALRALGLRSPLPVARTRELVELGLTAPSESLATLAQQGWTGTGATLDLPTGLVDALGAAQGPDPELHRWVARHLPADDHLARARHLLAAQDIDGAAACLDRLASGPADLVDLQEGFDVVRALEEAAGRGPGTLVALARFHTLRGDADALDALVPDAERLLTDPRHQVSFALARFALALGRGRWAHAEAFLEQASAQADQPALEERTRVAQAQLATLRSDLSEVLDVLSGLSWPEDGDRRHVVLAGRLLRAQALRRVGRLDELRALEPALVSDARQLGRTGLLGLILNDAARTALADGDLDRADALADEAVAALADRFPPAVGPHLTRVHVANRSGEHRRAQELLAQLAPRMHRVSPRLQVNYEAERLWAWPQGTPEHEDAQARLDALPDVDDPEVLVALERAHLRSSRG